MQFHINPGDEDPIYRQIMRQITEAIAGNRLRTGDKLASHRDLAERLVIAPLTVKKAYDELEREGYILTQRGRGTFIAERPPATDGAARRQRLRDNARKLVTEAYLGGVPLKEVLEAIREIHAEIKSREGTR
ncbi:MAG: GntR family transcriptional regulator [bacterium]|nr:GntR family transcriptional regulator [bacterium]